MKIKTFKDRADWLEARRNFICSTESPVLIGADSRSTPYQIFKSKTADVTIKEENDRMVAGRYLQDGIMRWYAYKYSVKVKPMENILVEAPEEIGMATSLDAWVEEEDVPLEIKLVDSLVARREGSGWRFENDEIKDMPIHIYAQIQHQMICTQRKHIWVVACVGGNSLFRGKFEARHYSGLALVNATKEFWDRVRDNNPYSINYNSDAGILEQLREPIKVRKTIDLSRENRTVFLFDEYERLKNQIKPAEEQLEAVMTELKLKAGDASKLICNDFCLNLSQVKDTPDKTIKQEDVGKIIKGRKGFVRCSITKNEAIKGDAQ